MPAYRLRSLLLLLAIVAVSIPAFFCNSPKPPYSAEGKQSPWRNVYDTSAHYVGMNTCRTCHSDIYETFIQTGMGQSFAPATKQKSAADFSPAHALVYDKDLDLYYKPFWKGDSLFFEEYRLEGKDTVHSHIQRIDYIVGSGQHTNSHIYSVNGYLYQAPITFYTQKHQWDLAPGFEKGASSRFSRLIESECMTCHNGYPEFVPNSENKYISLKSGIDCERCHGPGSIHVADKQAGNIVDTSKGPDYSIVNPRRLTTELQNNICQRCHLQGIAVLNDGKTFFDYRPGMQLSEVMNVFMPEYEGADDKMIMASHVERMKKSQCYVVSGKMSCVTCHNPHVSVRVTPQAQFINACQSCHGGQKDVHCSEDVAVRQKINDNCITCHMPHNGSIDIPHVAVTDHYIRKRPGPQGAGMDSIKAFLGLKCFNNDHVDAVTTGRAYMEFFERYNGGPALIDSALHYLDGQKPSSNNRDYIRAYYLLNNFTKVLSYISFKPADVADAWTAYRIGEAYFQTQQPQQALPYYKRAIEIWPYALDFQNKYGTCLLALNNIPEAEKVFDFVLKENPLHPLANANMGFVKMQLNQPTLAYDYLYRAIELNPDHIQTMINLAVWYHGQEHEDKAKQWLQRVLKKDPDNAQAKAMMADLG